MDTASERSDIVIVDTVLDWLPSQGLPKDAALPVGETIACRVASEVQAEIAEHAAENPSVEVGGLMIGSVYGQEGLRLVDVTGAVRGRHTQSSLGHVTFTIETWLDLIARRQQCGANRVVGWYHSHPGHGVFLSAADRFVHEGFFGGSSWYLALVVDPISGEQGVFATGGRRVAQCPGPQERNVR